MLKLFVTVLMCFNLGCSLFARKERVSLANQQAQQMDQRTTRQQVRVQALFNEALALMDLGKYVEAGRSFKRILKKYPNTDLELLIVYNLGGALEGLNRCDKAVNRYSQVIERSAGKFKKLEAKALLRTSYSYECLGDDAKVVATLLTLQKRSVGLGREVSLAEIPARLAAAYSRIGNEDLAQSYFLQAQEGLKKLNSDLRNPGKKRALLSKTLYQMGSMQKHSLEKMTVGAYVQSQRYLQKYLLMASELNDARWSPRSANEIVAAYDKITTKVASYEPEDVDPMAVREARSRQLSLLQGAISNIKNLRLQRFRERNEPRIISALFQKIDQKEQSFEVEMARVTRGTNLTKEALEREALKLPGRVLEKQKIKIQ